DQNHHHTTSGLPPSISNITHSPTQKPPNIGAEADLLGLNLDPISEPSAITFQPQVVAGPGSGDSVLALSPTVESIVPRMLGLNEQVANDTNGLSVINGTVSLTDEDIAKYYNLLKNFLFRENCSYLRRGT
ncbi:unnamed protein product, partial [Protopolystoma xenopodis]